MMNGQAGAFDGKVLSLPGERADGKGNGFHPVLAEGRSGKPGADKILFSACNKNRFHSFPPLLK